MTIRRPQIVTVTKPSRSIPTWEETLSVLITTNIENHRRNENRGSRGGGRFKASLKMLAFMPPRSKLVGIEEAGKACYMTTCDSGLVAMSDLGTMF